MTPVTVKAALYLRVSLDATGEHLAVDRQRTACRGLAADRGWEIVEEYCDNSVSASRRATARPAYDRMVDEFAAGRFDALVCWDLDRLTRQPRQLEDWIDAAQERGLLLTTANGEADLSTDGGRLFARIKASVARAEIERKSARQKAAAAQRAELGRAPRGVRLTGYTVVGEVVPEEAQLVADVFSRFAAGDSLRGIAAWLAADGRPTRSGRRWSPSTLRTILVNPRYAGRAVYCGRTTGQPGEWEAIVDENLFDRVQDQLSDPRRLSNREGTDRKHLGSGLYLCGTCGDPVRSHSRGRSPVDGGTSGARYRCAAGGHLTRIAASIDDYVRRIVTARLARPDVADLLTVPDDVDARRLADEVGRLRGRLAAIEADYDAGLIDGRRYAVSTEKVRAALTAAERARSRTVGSAGLEHVLGDRNPATAFEQAPLGVQRAVLSALLTVTLLPARRGHKFDPETVCIQWKSGDTPG